MSFFMRHLDSYCVRVGSLNVGTVTGRGRELGGYDGNDHNGNRWDSRGCVDVFGRRRG